MRKVRQNISIFLKAIFQAQNNLQNCNRICICPRWFFGNISRAKALDYLQFDVNIHGSFLIRESEKKDSSYALSIKAWQNKDNKFLYKHYLILQNEGKTQFWVKGAEK